MAPVGTNLLVMGIFALGLAARGPDRCLEVLFSVSRVDLVDLRQAEAFLALDVVRGELLVDRAPDDTARYELYVLRRAADLWPFERARRDAVLHRGAM